jgi:hypothetical protein
MIWILRFWAKVDYSGDCWLWPDALTEGYGMFSRDNKQHLAHRIAYEQTYGEIPKGLMVDHMCHTRHCVRPDHLRAVTHKQNQENRKGNQKNNTSGYRGVWLHKPSGRWIARVKHHGKVHHLGQFDDVHEAGKVAAEAREALFTSNPLKGVDKLVA